MRNRRRSSSRTCRVRRSTAPTYAAADSAGCSVAAGSAASATAHRPQHLRLASRELLPAAGLLLPHLDAHVHWAADALEQRHGRAGVGALGERAAGHHVNDLELARQLRLGRLLALALGLDDDRAVALHR